MLKLRLTLSIIAYSIIFSNLFSQPLLFEEDFETGTLPDGWSYDSTSWDYQAGGYNGNPSSAHNGNYNALFFDPFDVSKLISPQIDLSGISEAYLSFWHAQADWEGDQDELRVYYKTSSSGSWTLITEFTDNIEDWQKCILSLPELSDDYYIAFEATGDYGYGVVIDDIQIQAPIACTPPANQATNFTCSSVNENDVTINWTSGTDHVLVLAKEGSDVSLDPLSGTTYSANSDFTLGEDIGSENIVVFSGVGESVTVTNLTQGTNYYFSVYTYSDADKCYNISSPATGSVQTGYCFASGGGDEYINGVSIGTISNTETGSHSYEDFTDLTTDLHRDASYVLTIDNGNSYPEDNLGVWIDFNDNESFEDVGENVICTTDDGADGNYTLVLPASAALGAHRMRIRISYYGGCGSPCGTTFNGEVEDYTVNILEACTTPSQPDAIQGNTTPCEGTTETYSVTNVAGVTYTWDLPSGWTGSSTTDSITVTVGASGGTISVTPSNSCGNGEAATLSATVNNPVPPSSVEASSLSVCNGSGTTLFYTGGSGTTFNWYADSCGDNLVGTGNSVPVSPGSTTTYYGRWESSCGASTCLPVEITVNDVPSQPGAIQGNTTPCEGAAETYSVTNVAGVTYTWNLPSGWTGTGTTDSITVTVGASNGTISVTPSNSCGDGDSTTLSATVNLLPTAPSSVEASSLSVCNGTGTTLSYTGGSGTTFNWYAVSCGDNPVATGDSVSVSPGSTTTYYGGWENSCGVSACLPVEIIVNDVPSQTSAIQGNTTPDEGATETYSVTNIEDVTYTWGLPSDWTGSSTTNSITLTIGTSGGTISVTPSNSCGNGYATTLSAAVNQLPTDLSSKEELHNMGIKLFPNPTGGCFTIENQNRNTEMQVVIYNLNGETVLNRTYFNKVNEIDISHKSPGIYLIHIQIDDKTITDRLILKN